MREDSERTYENDVMLIRRDLNADSCHTSQIVQNV